MRKHQQRRTITRGIRLPSRLESFAACMDIFPVLRFDDLQLDEAAAMRSDWEAVGQDLLAATDWLRENQQQ